MSPTDDEDPARGEAPEASGAEDAFEDDPPDEPSRRGRLERILPELLKRGIEKSLEAGLDRLTKTDEALRGVVGDVKLPREIAGYLLAAVDDTKSGVMRAVSREFRQFLENTDLSRELHKALTSLSFEIKTEIRFVPNEQGDGVRPEVRTGSIRQRRVSRRRRSKTEP